MTNDAFAVRGSLRAAMSTEPRMVEALANPGVTFDRTLSQISKALVNANIGFVPSTDADRRDDARAEARILNRSQP